MDFDQAIAAHGAWKKKLADYLVKRDGSLNPSAAALDSKCPLGEWIHGEGLKYAKHPEFSALKNEHARFHKAVGDVIHHADAGQSITAETALGSKSEFAAASSAVVLAIMKLKQHVKA
jgi:Chemoreceptor zinc-binding domain